MSPLLISLPALPILVIAALEVRYLLTGRGAKLFQQRSWPRRLRWPNALLGIVIGGVWVGLCVFGFATGR